MRAKRLITLWVIVIGCAFAHAKIEPKYEQMHQLTPEQSTLMDEAIACEKIIIKNIQQRSLLVETYIQEMQPDQRLWQVRTGETYMLSRVDFRKTFTDKAYAARSEKTHGFFKGSAKAFASIGKALHLDKEPTTPTASRR
jgi:hypothetical protein